MYMNVEAMSVLNLQIWCNHYFAKVALEVEISALGWVHCVKLSVCYIRC